MVWHLKMNKILILPLIALSGCQATAAIQGIGQQIPGTISQVDSVLNGLILQKAVDFHNLIVQLEAIDAAKGTTLIMMPSMPVVGTTMTPTGPVVMPTPPVARPPIVPPKPVTPK